MAATPHPVDLPFTLKTASVVFLLGAAQHEFSDHIGQITLTPAAAPTGSWVSVNGKSISQAGVAPSWSVTFGLVQDLDPDGFLRWLYTNEGKDATVLVTLAAGADPIKADVVLGIGEAGGAADGSTLTSTVTLACRAKPEWAAGLVLP